MCIRDSIQKYHPLALPYLAQVLSPMLAHCKRVKQQQPGAATVFIGPCISKKEEADLYPGLCDAVLTFEDVYKRQAALGGFLISGRVFFSRSSSRCISTAARTKPVIFRAGPASRRTSSTNNLSFPCLLYTSRCV